jgi:hypothetical protein
MQALFLALVLWTISRRKRHALTIFSLGFLLEIALDAWLTGNRSPLLPQHTAWLSYVAIPFVILGDMRFFWLCERTLQTDAPSLFERPLSWAWMGRALGLALVVPVLQFVALKAAPALFLDTRRLFLFYELLFVLMLAVYAVARLVPALQRLNAGDPDANAARRGWLWRLWAFVLVQYLLWSGADTLILLHYDSAFALRLLANTMYYALFLPFAWATLLIHSRRTKGSAS